MAKDEAKGDETGYRHTSGPMSMHCRCIAEIQTEEDAKFIPKASQKPVITEKDEAAAWTENEIRKNDFEESLSFEPCIAGKNGIIPYDCPKCQDTGWTHRLVRDLDKGSGLFYMHSRCPECQGNTEEDVVHQCLGEWDSERVECQACGSAAECRDRMCPEEPTDYAGRSGDGGE